MEDIFHCNSLKLRPGLIIQNPLKVINAEELSSSFTLITLMELIITQMKLLEITITIPATQREDQELVFCP